MDGQIGTFGEALLRAMGNEAAGQSRLAVVADEALRSYGYGNRTIGQLELAIADDPKLIIELLDSIGFKEAILGRFIEKRLHALKAAGVHIPAGQCCRDTHKQPARRDAKVSGGQKPEDDHIAVAPAPNSAGQRRSDTLYRRARRPNPPRSLSAMKGAASIVSRCVLDTLQVNGQPLRSVTPDEALGYTEATRLRLALIERICAGLSPVVPIGDQITDAEAEQRARPT